MRESLSAGQVVEGNEGVCMFCKIPRPAPGRYFRSASSFASIASRRSLAL